MPTREDAWKLLCEYTASESLRKHMLAVEACVRAYARKSGADEEVWSIAALLHDAVEDCGGPSRLAEIHQKFGARVARIVEGCTDSDQVPKPPWRERKQRYIENVRREGADVLLVSAADKLYNVREILLDLRELGPAVWERFNGKRGGSLWYYRALVEAFRGGAPAALVADLDRAVSELELLAGSSG